MKAKNKELLGIPQIGVIKKFFEEKMYGFIQQEVGRDIKFNLSKLDRIGLDVLE
jgi:cold shock CspA family protein